MKRYYITQKDFYFPNCPDYCLFGFGIKTYDGNFSYSEKRLYFFNLYLLERYLKKCFKKKRFSTFPCKIEENKYISFNVFYPAFYSIYEIKEEEFNFFRR